MFKCTLLCRSVAGSSRGELGHTTVNFLFSLFELESHPYYFFFIVANYQIFESQRFKHTGTEKKKINKKQDTVTFINQ